ncbi:hypothetical protein FKY90_10385 [Enterococcus faecalis]|nr:hypothetical protein FKY90_10385 [Enterococcus faecalis]
MFKGKVRLNRRKSFFSKGERKGLTADTYRGILTKVLYLQVPYRDVLTVYQSIFDKECRDCIIFYREKRTTWMCGTRSEVRKEENKECLQLTN